MEFLAGTSGLQPRGRCPPSLPAAIGWQVSVLPGRALADLSLGRSADPQSPGAPTAGPEVHSSPRHETSADEVSNRDNGPVGFLT